jgi:S1-C subfamily serine protease
VFVEQVIIGTPAAQAGSAAGDEILAFDGTEVTSATQLKGLVIAKEPGELVQVEVATATGTETVRLRPIFGPVDWS